MTCDKEVSPPGTSTARASVWSDTRFLSQRDFQMDPLVRESAAPEVLAIIANRFSFVFNLKGSLL